MTQRDVDEVLTRAQEALERLERASKGYAKGPRRIPTPDARKKARRAAKVARKVNR